MRREEFKRQLEELWQATLWGIWCYNVWKELWPTPESVGVIDKFRGFFRPVRESLREAMLMNFSKAFDRYSKATSTVST